MAAMMAARMVARSACHVSIGVSTNTGIVLLVFFWYSA
jgi:hypothetical protein